MSTVLERTHTARTSHDCDVRRSIYCTGVIGAGDEYSVTTTPPWAYDELERISETETALVRVDRHPDGGHRGWRQLKTCQACT